MAAAAALVAMTLGLLVALAPGADAQRRDAWKVNATFVNCAGEAGERPVAVTVLVFPSGIMADAAIYEAGADPRSEMPVLVADMTGTAFDGVRFEGRGVVAEPDDGGMGIASAGEEVSVHIDLTAHDPDRVRYRQRIGNDLVRWKGEEVTYDGAGTITIADSAHELSCGALLQRWDGMANNPNGFVLRLKVGVIDCDVTDAVGNRMLLAGNGFGLDAWVYAPDGELLLNAFSHDDGNEVFTLAALDDVLLVHDPVTGQGGWTTGGSSQRFAPPAL